MTMAPQQTVNKQCQATERTQQNNNKAPSKGKLTNKDRQTVKENRGLYKLKVALTKIKAHPN